MAMGSGENAIFLAGLGWTVEGVDVSPEAISSALESARKAEVTIQTQVGDLEKGYRIKRDTYDVIICCHYLQRSLIPQIKEGLRQGGMVVGGNWPEHI